MDGSGDIRGTFFNDDCDKWMPVLEVNQVYKFTRGQLKPANRQFNHTQSDVEITFGRDTHIEHVSDADAPKVTFNFRTIRYFQKLRIQVSLLDRIIVCLTQ